MNHLNTIIRYRPIHWDLLHWIWNELFSTNIHARFVTLTYYITYGNLMHKTFQRGGGTGTIMTAQSTIESLHESLSDRPLYIGLQRD